MDPGDPKTESAGAAAQQKMEAAAETEAEVTSTPLAPPATIFVSYRVDPDHVIAAAVRRLLQTSLDPEPEVFVSQESLRPSAIGYKPQLQAAAQRAKAFIGIITPASKTREWIIFEAGAAWGRGQWYAPLLVDATPDDLSSTIGDYQATNAGDKDAMYRLVTALADQIGAEVKDRFGQRYSAFQRALETRNAAPAAVEEEEGADPDRREFMRGLSKLFAGERKAGEEILNRLAESLEPSAPLAQEIKIGLAVHRPGQTRVDTLSALEQLDPDVRKSPVWHYWMGLNEAVPTAAIEHFRACIATTPPNQWWAGLARIDLAEALVDIRDDQQALGVIHEALTVSVRRQRSDAAFTFTKLWKQADPFVRLLVLAFGIASDSERAEAVEAASDLAIDNEWVPLSIHFGTLQDELKNGSSLNLARALHKSLLVSHAYEAYKRAADRGINVAFANMGSLLLHNTVPASALEMLERHSGPFNVSDPAFPYEIRAKIEKAIHEEGQQVERLKRMGRTVAGMLASTAGAGLDGMRRAGPLAPAYSNGEGVAYALKASGPFEYVFDVGRRSGKVRCPVPEFPFWIMDEPRETTVAAALPKSILGEVADAATSAATRTTTVLAQKADGTLLGVSYAFKDSSAVPAAVRLVPIDSSATATTFAPPLQA